MTVNGMVRPRSYLTSRMLAEAPRKAYRTREEAKADVFDYIERFYKAKRRHSTIGFEPHGVRTAGRISLSGRHPNRVQAMAGRCR
jgi:transposase InsO family protein